LIKQSEILNEKTKNRFITDKNIFSEILKNMGKNVIKDLFLKDHVEFLSKANFRRFIEVKAKNYLGKDFLDFECLSHIHLFEKMKKSLLMNPLLNKKNKIANSVIQTEVTKERIISTEETYNQNKKSDDEMDELHEEKSNLDKNKNLKNGNKKEKFDFSQNNCETIDVTDKIRINSYERNFQMKPIQDDILNIIIDDKNNFRSEDEEKREKIFYLVQSYVIYF
jgi:hypothetical protein